MSFRNLAHRFFFLSYFLTLCSPVLTCVLTRTFLSLDLALINFARRTPKVGSCEALKFLIRSLLADSSGWLAGFSLALTVCLAGSLALTVCLAGYLARSLADWLAVCVAGWLTNYLTGSVCLSVSC